MGAIFMPKNASADNLRQEFLRVHYSTDSNFIGFTTVELKPEKKRKMKLVGAYMTNDAMAERVGELRFARKCDYYISANSFSEPKRSADNLFQIKNIVIDIDSHIKENTFYRKKRIDGCEFLRDAIIGGGFEGYDIPTPNSVILTGRGLQLWYALEDASYKLADAYKKTAESLCAKVSEFLSNIPIYENMFSVDIKASANAAGLFRMPGTFNTKAGRYGEISILHDAKINIFDFAQVVTCVDNKPKNMSAYKRNWVHKYSETNIVISRVDSLKKLILLRQQNGITAAEENRDLILFYAYCSVCDCIDSEEEIDTVIRDVNSLFLCPLPEREWQAYLSTARRRHYHITTARIIKELGITPEEQSIIGLYQKKGSTAKKEAKQERNKTIISLAKQGFSKKEISASVGCSAQTVARVLEAEGIKTNNEVRQENALKRALKGMSLKKIVSLFGYSLTRAKEIIAKAKEILKNRRKRIAQIRERFQKSKVEMFRRKRISNQKRPSVIFRRPTFHAQTENSKIAII